MLANETANNDTLNIIIGLAVLISSLILMVILTWWSRRRIERIAQTTGRSARELQHELDRDDA
jgi:hypothetical protein